MSRRPLTLIVATLLVLALGVAGAWLPVPYVVLSPGPTENTLGTLKGKPLIAISGRQTYPTDGKLSLVTVAYQGGPGARVDLFMALRGWLDPTVAVVPEETIFPKATTVKEVEEQNTQEMTDSQQLATAAALNELKIPIGSGVMVAGTQKGKPAEGKLKAGDEIVDVDGQPVKDLEQVRKLVGAHKVGDEVRFTVKRTEQGKGAPSGTPTTLTVTLTTVAGADKQPVVGVVMSPMFKFPFDVRISVGEVGGPSAGLMFALGIVDKLTPGDLTGGKSVAGTGTITPEGAVGPIGGIQQKMVGARDAGATVFLTPAANCADALRAVPDNLRLVKVETLHGAIQAMDALRTGSGKVPSCSAQ
ncbi:YlbL family protein [Rhizohabitans arisaemae]|uniref:YlbL family protein n=1 Tax=Rhizohabitans arisaemae TaxID=2720610 RepID=UPI0024B1DDAC|nr:PDZ domain-containing protein [Rhizohabitans arisaemae]